MGGQFNRHMPPSIHPSIHSLCSCSCSRTPVSPAHQEPRPPPAASTCCGPISFRTGTLPCCFFSSPCVLHPTCTKHVPGRCHQNTLCFGSPSTNRGTQLKRRGKNRVSYCYQGRRIVYGPSIPRGCDLHVAPSCQPRPGPAGSYNTPEPGIPMTHPNHGVPFHRQQGVPFRKGDRISLSLTSGQSKSMCLNPPATCLVICFALQVTRCALPLTLGCHFHVTCIFLTNGRLLCEQVVVESTFAAQSCAATCSDPFLNRMSCKSATPP
jgi:hypothetical protein